MRISPWYFVAALTFCPLAARATITSYTSLNSWQAAATSGTQSSISLSGLPGNDLSVSSATISGVTFSGTLQECSGGFPSSCSGSGGTTYLIGYPSVTVTPPAGVNVSAVAADFAAYYGNAPQNVVITATTFSGASLQVNINPVNSISFIGFISSDPTDPIAVVSFNELNASNYAAVMDFFYYSTPYPALSITTSSLPGGIAGNPYSQTIAGSGGSGHYSWSASGLPSGLNMSSGGTISGTPAVSGTSNVQVTLSDTRTSLSTGPQPFSLTIQQTTTTSVSSSLPSPSTFGQSITLTAAVTPGTATGQVVFSDDGVFLGVGTLSSGQASLTTKLLPSGVNSVKASYQGNATFVASIGTLSQTIRSKPQAGFQTGPLYSTSGNASTQIVAADFNHDGIPDIAAVNYGANSVSIMTGSGAGAFGSAVTYGVGSHPCAIATGDFNEDGFPDLAVPNCNDGNVSILLGQANGSFQAASGSPFTTGVVGSPGGITLADFNADGHLDLAVATFGNASVVVLFGTGSGSFGAPSTFAVGSNPAAVVAGDFNNDGIPDIAVANYGSTNICVMLSLGSGNFGSPACTTTNNALGSLGSGPDAIAVGDFNNDGFPDIVTANRTSAAISVFLNSGSGTFATPVTYSLAGGSAPVGVVTGDFNGDGQIDIATTDFNANDVSVFLNGGSGTFSAPTTYSTGTTGTSQAASAIALDLNSDGVTDLLVSNYTAASVTELLGINVTNTVLTTSPNPGVFGQNVALTATVSPATATGTITFSDTGTPIGSPVTISGGVAVLNDALLGVGSHTLTASYSGDPLDAASNSNSVSQTISQAPTTTMLTASPNPSTFGTAVTLTATVSFSGASGTITFKDGTTILGTVGVTTGSAQFGISTVSVGTHALTATYNGDANYLASVSSSVSQVVNRAPTTTIVTSSANPSAFGQSVTFTAMVSPASASGTVTFLDGASMLGTGTIAGGVATFTTSALTVAAHPVTASYNGDGNDLASTSTVLTQTVNQAATAVALTSGLNPSVFGQSVTFTAIVSPGVPTGTITFKDGTTTLGTGTLTSGATTFSTTGLGVGSHAVTAAYGGDSNNAPSVSTAVTQVVNKIVSATTISSSANPDIVGQPVNLTATVTPNSATGIVTFLDGTASLGSASLTGGTASITVQSFSYGTHPLTASYAGDANDTSSVSTALPQISNYTALSITNVAVPGGTAGSPYGPVAFTVNGGSGTFTWTATGLPSGLILSSGGLLSGVPAGASTSSVQITATDSVSSLTISKTYTLTVVLAPISITGPADLGDVAVGGTVSASFSAKGGTGTYSWSISGAPGLGIDGSGKVTGAASSAGNFTARISANDIAGGFGSANATLAVLGVTAAGLPVASTSSSYNASVTVTGGVPPYTYAAAGLPPGIGFSGGSFSGKPTIAGSYSVTVTVTDSRSVTAMATASITVTGPAALSVASSSLAGGTVGQPYSQTVSATGGQPAYSWALSGGALPAGLSLSSSGTVSGIPTTPTPSAVSFGVKVTDNSGGQAVGSISLDIQPAPLQISASSFPTGQAGLSYPPQTLTASGGIAPYTFAVSSGALPSGITLSNGQISGTPVAEGSNSFTITVTDAASPPATGSSGGTITINPKSADLVLSAASAPFTFAAGTTGAPPADVIAVSSSDVSQILGFSAASSVPWVDVNGSSATPGSISISLNSTGLGLAPAGSPYSGTIAVTCKTSPCTGKSQTISVTLNVQSPPPQLKVDTGLLSFASLSTSAQASSSSFTISNAGGGSLAVQSVTASTSWISVSAPPATLAAGVSSVIAVSINPGGLSPGYYRGSISVASSAGNASVPVALLVSNAASMALGPAGTQFSLPAGGALGNAGGSFLVSTTSLAPITFSASVQPGASWLSSGNGGSASAATPGSVTYSIDPSAAAALAPGAYYGTVRVFGSNVVNTPLDFQVILNVAPSASAVIPDPEPAGLVFIGSGSDALPPQSIQVFASSKNAIGYQASPTSAGWLTIAGGQGNTSASSPGQVLVTASPSGLAPGIYRGSVSFSFPSSEVRTVNVTLIVPSPPGTSAASARATGPEASGPAACVNPLLAPTQTGLVTNFQTPASWPTPLAITLADSCGKAIANGQVVATFSNGDPPLALTLVNGGAGLYSGTWTPRTTASQITITARATAPGYAAATAQISGQVAPNSAPVLAANGTGDIFNPTVGGGLGPGNIVQIYGSGLASQATSPAVLPLPTAVSGTSVVIGGIKSPLYYVSPTQVNAQIPFELAPNQQYQVIVNANGAFTTPQPIQLNAGAPAVLAFTSGAVVAQHQDGTLISAAAPAAPGEFIVIYLTGLGATTVDVPTGQASPTNPLAYVVDQPSLLLGDMTITPLFAGLTPGLVGLYQINFQVPFAAADGNYNLSISQNSVVSNSTLLQIHH